ncbi:MAG: aspartyl/glutamyl-tRNA amidotransferase subunit A [Cenarchaeum symbiont of Oopsacas minuta]|nr:aspartyl/glutamyl-tRNA amidotransferase subunit A [Cenarchaeum symbiont of Oopsacas minuta]
MNLQTTILEYVQNIKNNSTSCEEFMAATMERIKKLNAPINAHISIFEDAISKAKKIDVKIQSGDKVGGCYGMPVSIKDNICMFGKKTTCASKMLECFIPPYDATVVQKLHDFDAIITGKTNMDEFGMGTTTEFSTYGNTCNPWNTKYVPGGSSGGSAASVASLQCLASLGSDTGGSIRNPASFCSVVGFKPTYGLVSRYGLVAYSNSIEQIGPLTRTVKDAAFMMNIISGKDEHDVTTIDGKSDYLSDIDAGVSGKKIGILRQMMGDGASSKVVNVTDNAAKKLQDLGAVCDDVELDTIQYAVAAYYTITSAEAASNLARYDNIRYGYEMSSSGFTFDSYISEARRKFGPEVKRRMILGGFVPSAGYTGKYYLKALKVKSRLSREIANAFKKFDILLAPTVPILPFEIGEKIDDPMAQFLIDSNTVLANLTGRPAISVPFGHSDGLPIGVQMMADSMQDARLLQTAYSLESCADIPKVPIL